MRTAVRRNIKYGVDVIKFCGTGGVFSKGDTPGAQQYTFQEMQALIDEAHMSGRKVAVHAHGADGIKAAIRAGVDTVEHASLIDDEGFAAARKVGIYLSMDIYNSDYTQAEGTETRRAGRIPAQGPRDRRGAARELSQGGEARREADVRHRRGRLSAWRQREAASPTWSAMA